MKFLRAFIAIAVVVVSGGLLAGCFSGVDSSLKLQPNPVLSGGPGWAVVKVAYVRLKESPSQEARDIAPLRSGSVFEIEGRDFGSAGTADKGLWYKLKAEGSDGWAREADLDVFGSKEQADRAAAAYR